MAVKEVLHRLSPPTGHAVRQRSVSRDRIVQLTEYGVRMLLSFLLARATVLDGLSPFAIALLAATPHGIANVFTLLGAVCGYFTVGPLLRSVKYTAMAVLVFASVFVLRDIGRSKKLWFPPAIAGVVTACIGLVFLFDRSGSQSAVLLYALDVILTSALAYFYRLALSPWGGDRYGNSAEIRHAVSLLILLSTLLISLSGVVLFRFISVGRILATTMIMVLARKGGAGFGCTGGLSFGIAMDASLGGNPIFCMIYGIAGLISGIFSKQNRLFFTIVFITANATATLWLHDTIAMPAALYETFVASVCFLLLPNGFLARVGFFFPSQTTGYGILRSRDYTKNHVLELSVAFRDLYETVRNITGGACNDNNIATVFDRAAELACRTCAKSYQCWQQDYLTTFNVMNDLTPKLQEHGLIQKEDFPPFFIENCRHFPELSNAINQEYRALRARSQYRSKLAQKQGALFNQYADMATILHGIAEEMSAAVGVEPILERKLQKYLRGLNIDVATAIFRDKGGRLHAELSGFGIYQLKKDPAYLNKLSSVLSIRLCASLQEQNDKLILLEAEPYAVSVGIASKKKKGQEISGDKGSYFKTDEGVFYIILSDGMGTGSDAAKCSSGAVKILERLLRAGVSPATSLHLLNGLMLLKNEADSTCATIDLMALNLFTGHTTIFKYGAAPSYIRKGTAVKRVSCSTLAAGLGVSAADTPDVVTMKLEPNNCAVIVTDGVLAGGDDQWIQKKLADFQGEHVRDLATELLDTAAAQGGCDDDMTVLVVSMEARL